MAWQPFVFVGIGESGAQTLDVVRGVLGDTLRSIGWEGSWPAGWQLVHFDLPADGEPYSVVSEMLGRELAAVEPDPWRRHRDWDCWRPVDEEDPDLGASRSAARARMLASLDAVEQGLTHMLTEAVSATAVAELREAERLVTGRDRPGPVRPRAVVVGAVPGATGSGITLDVVDVLRSAGCDDVIAVLYTPEVFDGPDAPAGLDAAENSVLALSEIAVGLWDSDTGSNEPLFASRGVRHPRRGGGPTSVFLIGAPGESSSAERRENAYATTGRNLALAILDERMTEAFDPAGPVDADEDGLGLSSPYGPPDPGVFRGFGGARLSVGGDRFHRYAADRLLRMVGERLLDGALPARASGEEAGEEETSDAGFPDPKAVADEAWPEFVDECAARDLGRAVVDGLGRYGFPATRLLVDRLIGMEGDPGADEESILETYRGALCTAVDRLSQTLRPYMEAAPGDSGIPEDLRPQPGEIVLADLDDFPARFDELFAADPRCVAAGGAGAGRGDDALASIIEQARFVVEESGTTTLALDPQQLSTSVHAWLADPEGAFAGAVRESLGHHLTDPDVPESEHVRRCAALVTGFIGSLSASAPALRIDPRMAGAVGGPGPASYVVRVSELNVPGSLPELRQRLQNIWTSWSGTAGTLDFTDTPRSDLTVTVVHARGHHLVEIASVMDVVARESADVGAGRLRHRRTRPVSRWTPLAPQARRLLLTGWFVARLTGEAVVEGEDLTGLSVTVDGEPLPIPVGVRPPDPRDQVGRLLEGLFTAMIDGYRSRSLDGLWPYRYLIALGASMDDEHNPLTEWLAGDGSAGIGRVRELVAAGSTVSGAALAQLNAWEGTYWRWSGELDDVADAQRHPTLEVCDEVLEALARLRRIVDRTPRPAGSVED
ncbi:MAG: tubulin-like doman-containing protein [Gordonia sp. (in: high G+C Gram-positive bacteria)]|uniref:tubulin-like doman-containing protein n=1 Tax=Gordonia sp. (in: high G+C Gram-positive bacteria) TaxID=84139 RepID=UPI0039E5490E